MGVKHNLGKVTPFSWGQQPELHTAGGMDTSVLKGRSRWCLSKLHKHQSSTIFQPIHHRSLMFSVQAWFLCGIHFPFNISKWQMLIIFLPSNDLLSSHWPSSAFWVLCCWEFQYLKSLFLNSEFFNVKMLNKAALRHYYYTSVSFLNITLLLYHIS